MTDRARLAGAVNTLVLEDGAACSADNTDLPGRGGRGPGAYDGPVRAATVLGGGATAASIGLALVDLGVPPRAAAGPRRPTAPPRRRA